jgi:uncharacterized membrane protein YeaQ/YmgE (transglycosylase-associated protein family)
MVLFVWIIIGSITGWLAGQILKDKDFGTISDCIVGSMGALAGGFLANLIFKLSFAINSSTLPSLIMVFVGAIITSVAVRFRRTVLNSSGNAQRQSAMPSPTTRTSIDKQDDQPGDHFNKQG